MSAPWEAGTQPRHKQEEQVETARVAQEQVCRVEIERRILAKKLRMTGSVDDQVPTFQSQCYALFNDPNSSYPALWISNIINLVILASTYAFVAETTAMYRTPSSADFWFGMECTCVIAFTIDFVVRLVACPLFEDFRADPMNWVDFIAIVPFYMELVFSLLDLDPGALSSLRVIRVLRLARILKIINKLAASKAKKKTEEEAGEDGVANDDDEIPEGEFNPENDDGADEDVGAVIGDIVVNSASALSIPLYFMLLALIVYASLEYFVERVLPIQVVQSCLGHDCVQVKTATVLTDCSAAQNCSFGTWYEFPDGFIKSNTDDDMFQSIPDSVWWCIVTMTTVGYGDKYPLSGLGMLVATATAMTGIFFISMPLAIVGSAFANAVDKINDAKIHKEAARDSAQYGYGMMSYVNNHHALMLMKVKEIQGEIMAMDRSIRAEAGALSSRDSNHVYEVIMDHREQLTGFSAVLHKELYLHAIKTNKEAKEFLEKDDKNVAMDTKQSPAAKEMLLAMYNKYDLDKDGMLSYDELEAGIKDSGMDMALMINPDTNADARVSKLEWLNFFKPIPDSEIAGMKAWLEGDASAPSKDQFVLRAVESADSTE